MHNDGLRGVPVAQIGSRVDICEQASGVDSFLYYLHFFLLGGSKGCQQGP